MVRKKLCLVILLVGFAAHSQTIGVLSYNIRYDNPKDSINHWDNRKDFLISQLNFYEPVVFGTQEGLLHQLKDIKEDLKGYDYIGKGRDDGDNAGEFSAIFFKKNEVEVLEMGTFWLSETPEVPSKGWDAAIKRVCTYGLFQNKTNTKKFWVFNTHFDHVGEQARQESVVLILKKIDLITTVHYPVILMGDLNLEPDHPGIKHLSSGMNDVHVMSGEKAFGPSGTYNGFNISEPVIRRIDYIFTSKNDFEVEKYAILSDSKDGRYPSDHLPVYAKLKFRR